MLTYLNAAFWCAIDFLQSYNGAVTAMATVFVGAFTYVLARVTGRQVRLARDEFNSTHRPKIIVHAVEIAADVTTDSAEPTVGASVAYFNIGDTPAQLTGISAKITRRHLPLQSGLGLGIGTELTALRVPEGMIEPGQREFFAVHSLHTLGGERFA